MEIAFILMVYNTRIFIHRLESDIVLLNEHMKVLLILSGCNHVIALKAPTLSNVLARTVFDIS